MPIESSQEPGLEHRAFFSHFADGEGSLFSQLLLVNASPPGPATAQIHLRNDDGGVLPIDLNGVIVQDMKEATIPAGGMGVLGTDGLGDFVTGSVTAYSDRPLAGLVLFSGSVGAAGVGSSPELDSGFIAPVEQTSTAGIRTGIAMMSLEDARMDVHLSLCDSDGRVLATAVQNMPVHGHAAWFVDEVQWNGTANLKHRKCSVTGVGCW